ncbi:MAG: sigma-70 family RNA polymerase sigma factor [Acidimicrobiia bacterium]|nr:sigma-70 family RNA polymerase sigma factor [Acidimicrobiia bacterium]
MDTSDGAVPEELYLLIAQYRDDAFRLARRLTRNTAEAEDIAQTALLNVLRRAEYIEDETKVRSYLLTAVRNVWRNHLRSRGGRRFLGTDVAEMVPSTDVEPDEQVLNALEVSLASAAMNTLSPKSREVIKLRYIDRLDFHELSARLGITPVAARQRAHRAREELVGACMELSARNGEGICRQIRGRLGRYHRGLLGRVVRAEVEFHLAECPACSSCYEQLIELYGHRLGSSPKDEA